MVIDKLKITIIPPSKSKATTSEDVLLTFEAQGAREVVWQRKNQRLPSGHVIHSFSGYMCNCRGSFSGWREDGGLLTDKAVLPVTQIRLGDLDGSHEKGYYTLGKLKCYGVD